MMNKMHRYIRSENGQGMTEYIIIVALIAIAAIGIITVFGHNLRNLFKNSANALGGNESATENTGLSNTSARRKSLSNFGSNQQSSVGG